jgi:ubiquitin C-terminal hydrolase
MLVKDFQLDKKVLISQFQDIFRFIYPDIYESLERIQYIPYLYFRLKCEDSIREKNCLEILMKNNKDLKAYIEGVIGSQKDYFILDQDFWVNWCEYTKWTIVDKKELFEDKKPEEDEKNQTNKFHTPKIDNSRIADYSGRLKQGLVYFSDYVIVTSKIYELFQIWYINLGPDIKRSRIDYELDSSNSRTSYVFSKRKSKGNISNIEQRYEIEIYPIFFKFYLFDDLVSKVAKPTLNSLIDHLCTLAYLCNDSNSPSKLFPFSRKTKYKDLLSNLDISKKYENRKLRLWIFHQNKFFLTSLEKSLEDDSIKDFAIAVCEINIDKKWPSENLENEEVRRSRVNKISSRAFVGLTNIGNTCYMNSVMQVFLNNYDLKNFIIDETTSCFSKSINYKNKFGAQGEIIAEFISLMKEKWQNQINTIQPKIWKDIIGKKNEQFAAYDQQDAHEYINFLLDILHEETNISSENEYVNNPEKFDGTASDLGEYFWANNLRKNFSLIHALFQGQLKSTLTCQKCSHTKINYETFTTLSLPIPQESKITLEIILFRLPFTLKVYYSECNQFSANMSHDFQKLDLRSQLKAIKKQSLDYNVDLNNIDDSIISERSVQNKIFNNVGGNLESIEHIYYEKESNHNQKELYLTTLTTNIPIRIKLEVERKEKVQKIIFLLKKIYDLELEEEDIYTDFLILNQGSYVDMNLKIDECFQHNETMFIYETLNLKGINKLFKYQRDTNEIIVPLNSERINIFNQNMTQNIRFEELKDINNSHEIQRKESIIIKEFLVPIIHRYRSSTELYLFNKISYCKIETFINMIILSNYRPLKLYHLYEMIWEKFEYLLNNPTIYEKKLWWKKNSKELKDTQADSFIKLCTPFVLKIIKKDSKACTYCPWFKFCTGCVADPSKSEYFEINSENIIVVEWCSEVFRKDISESNMKLIINHSSVKKIEEIKYSFKSQEKSLSLEDCLSSFTEKEDMEEELLKCENCKKATSWYKQYEIERLPPYLVLVLKRFKYTKMYKRKMECLVDLPINDLEICTLMNGKKGETFNLFGVVNHIGSMNSGHYTSFIRHDQKWVKYDDSNSYEIEEALVKSPNAYILIYKSKNSDYSINSNYLKLLSETLLAGNEATDSDNTPSNLNISSTKLVFDSSFRISKNFFPGEPVATDFGQGYVKCCYFIEGSPYIKVKLNFGWAHIMY